VAYDQERKARALDDLSIIVACADEAGISEHLFVGFGLLLGIVREWDFIANDDDVDMCVKSDKITPDQEIRYFAALARNGMFTARRKIEVRPDADGWTCDEIEMAREYYRGDAAGNATSRPHPARFAWFSLRKRSEHNKFCHWFMLPWNGCYWHTKGRNWVAERKFSHKQVAYDLVHDEALMLGTPQGYLDEIVEIEFRGVKLNVPVMAGHCLDYWYPGWLTPAGGSSAKRAVCRVPSWADPSRWKVQLTT